MLSNLGHKPTLAVIELASCRGCQCEIMGLDEVLPDMLEQVDVAYWNMISSKDMPDEVDIAVVEGAVVNDKSIKFLKHLRETSNVIIALGACACGLDAKKRIETDKIHCLNDGEIASVCDVIDVDYCVLGCPIDEREFVATLQKAIFGHNTFETTATLCGQCKGNEVGCFFGRGGICAGLITTAGCGAICTRLGRECMGCRGVSCNAQFEVAKNIASSSDVTLDKIRDACSILRFVNHDIDGLDDDFVAFTSSRFNGRWSNACTVEALKKIELHRNIEVAEEVSILRELLLLGELIRNHVTYVYFTEMRKAYGFADLYELEEARASEVEEAFACRHAGTSICEVIGGRSVHPITAVIGGFTHLPEISQIEGLEAQLAGVMVFAIRLVDECNEVWEKFDTPEITPAMRRILATWDNLSDSARFAAAKVSLVPGQQDPRRECVAVAVELVNSLARAQQLCNRYISLASNK